jgi:hypothetical protein
MGVTQVNMWGQEVSYYEQQHQQQGAPYGFERSYLRSPRDYRNGIVATRNVSFHLVDT